MIQKVKDWIGTSEQFKIIRSGWDTIFEVKRLSDGFNFELGYEEDGLYRDSVISIDKFCEDLIHVLISYTVEHPVTKIVSVDKKLIPINDIIVYYEVNTEG